VVKPRIKEAHGISDRALREKDPAAAIELWRWLLGEKFGKDKNPGH
jgi:hypothetical protein